MFPSQHIIEQFFGFFFQTTNFISCKYVCFKIQRCVSQVMAQKDIVAFMAILLTVLSTTNASYINKQLRDALRPQVDQNIQRLNYAIYHAARNNRQVKILYTTCSINSNFRAQTEIKFFLSLLEHFSLTSIYRITKGWTYTNIMKFTP